MTDDQDLHGLLDAGIQTYMGTPHIEPSENELSEVPADVGVLGIPFDSTSLSRTGSNQGPKTIRDMSCQTHPYHFEYDLSITEAYDIVDFGDVSVLPGNAERTIDQGMEVLGRLFKHAIAPVVLGGDHSISIAPMQAYAEAVDNGGLVVFDTHLDTATSIAGEEYNHACPVARIVEDTDIPPEQVCLIGISGTGNPSFEREYAEDEGINVFPLDEVIQRGPVAVAEDAVDILETRGVEPYVSIDIDVLDVGFAPGTGVPSPAGMTTRELLQALGVVASNGFAGLDVVEVSPAWDKNGVTAVTACRLIADALAARASGEANGVGTKTRALRTGPRS